MPPFRVRFQVFMLVAALCTGCGDRAIPSPATAPTIPSFTLVDQSANLSVGQGYASGTATDGTPLNFFFDTQTLYRSSGYDALEPVAKNNHFLPSGTTHMGAGDYSNGQIYAVIEHWQSCSLSSAPIFIATFNAASLALESTIEITSSIPEASGIAIVPDAGQAIVSSFCDSHHLYLFRMSDWGFAGTLPLQIPVSGIQGVSYRDGFVYISGTNGALYRLCLADRSMQFLMQSPVNGEFEGLDFHGSQLRWLVNRSDGAHILYSYEPAASATP